MKPHIPLLLLSALLATAPVKANLAEMATIPGHPAFIPDHDFFIVENNPSSIIPPINKVGCFWAERPRSYLQPDLRAIAFFKEDDNMLALHGGSIASLLGSIILKDVLLNGTSLTTKADGIEDAVWGLPQVAIDGVFFGSQDISVTSNYCTIRNWSGDAMNFLLGITGASFEMGSAAGNVSITSLTNVKINTLAITNGGLSIHDYSPIVEPKDWLVELCNIKVSDGVTVDVASNAKNSVKIDNLTITYGALSIHCSQYSQQYAPNDGLVELNDISASGGVTVDAPSNYGRINVNNLTTGSFNVASSLLAREINLFGEINCAQLNIQAGSSVALDGCVLSCNQLTISSIDVNKPDITCNGSINVQGTATLTGRNIYGTFVKADLSAGEWKITADECVDYTGALRGNSHTITAKNVKLSGDVSGDTINISASEEVALAGNMMGGMYTIEAEKVNISANVSGDTIGISASTGVTLAGNMNVADTLEILGRDYTRPDITLTGSLTVGKKISLVGMNIRGSNADDVFSSPAYTIDAVGEVNIKGTFQGGILTVDTVGAITLGAIGSLEKPVSSASITSYSAKPETTVTVESFIGESLTVKAIGAITLKSIGSLEKPVVNAVITGNFDKPVTVESFHGGENGTLRIDSQGVITIGKQPEQNSVTSAIPVYEGNVTINYLGEGTGAENWDVAMLGVMQGSVTVNAEKGKVNAGVINGTGDITAKQISMASYTGSNLKLTASDVVTVRGNMNVTGTAEKPASITAGEEVVLNGESNDLAHTNIKAPLVTVAQKLILKDQSRVEGNVTSETGGTVTVENSAIIGKVGRMGDTAVTVNLTNADIGGAENFSRLEVQSASRITSDLVLNEGAELSFVLTQENLTTPVLTIGRELKMADPDSAAFTINLTGSNLPVLKKYALITTTNHDQAPEFWDSDNVSLTGLSNDETTLFWEGGTLYFSLGGQDLEVATWTGAASSLWNKEDANWKQNDATYLYKDRVAVVFNDEGKAGEVLLNGTLTPRSVLVENSQGHDYTFSGEGEPGEDKLAGEIVLVKQGSGTLTVNTANDYEGGTTINGGTLVIRKDKALGTGNVVLGNATLNLGGCTMDNDVSVTGEDSNFGAGWMDGHLSVEDGRKLTLLENTTITEKITLGDGATLNLGGNNNVFSAIVLLGDATLGNGRLHSDVTVGTGNTLTLCEVLSGENAIILNHGAKLNLGGNELSLKVNLEGDATIGNGELNANLTVGEGFTLSLSDKLMGGGIIYLAQNSTLDLSGKILSNKVALTGNAYIKTGILDGDTIVSKGCKLTLKGTLLFGTGTIFLEDNSELDLNKMGLFHAVTVTGNAIISNGTLYDNTLTVGGGAKLTFGERNVDTSGSLKFHMGNNAAANLNGSALSGSVTLDGNASLGNGTLNTDVTVGTGNTLTLCDGNLGGSGVITLAERAKLNLGELTLSNQVYLGGSATIGNGALDADLTVGDGFTLTLSDDLRGQGTIILKEKSRLNTDSGGTNPNILYNALEVAGNATICGTFEGKISVDAGKELIFESGTSARSGIDLGQNSALDLGTNKISTTITLVGDASLGNGTVNADVAVGDSHKLTLTSNMGGTGTIILNEQSSLNTHGDEVTYNLSNAVKVAGNASIHGAVSGKITVDEGKKLEFKNGSTANGGIDLAQGSELDLGGNQTSTAINLAGDATIGNGTIENGSLDVAVEKTLTLRGNVDGTRTISLNTDSTLRLTDGTSVANKITGGLSTTIVQIQNGTGKITGDIFEFTGNVTVESRGVLNIMNADSMDNVTVDVTLGRRAILGVYTDANAVEASEGTLTISADHRLAAAFHAQLNANLVMESGSVLDVAATGGESGGLHMGSTVTLDPGNVLLSEADMDAVNGLRYMQAYDLFSGVDGLSLGGDFLSELGLADKWVKASEVFANDLFKSAEREYYLFYSGKNQGGAVGYEGTVYLMRIPEPATGTLSLLALAALAARRRRK